MAILFLDKLVVFVASPKKIAFLKQVNYIKNFSLKTSTKIE